MNCRQVQTHLDNLLVAAPDEALRSKLDAHIAHCPDCARACEDARRVMASFRRSLQLSRDVHASSNLKERIMNQIIEMDAESGEAAASQRRPVSMWKPALAAAAVMLVVAVASLFKGPEPGRNGPPGALVLFGQAWAAEEALFAGDGIVHIVNEIIVKPVSNPVLARMRWFPVVSVEATGQRRFHQLALPAEPDEGFTVEDQAWYDPATGRFARLFTVDGKAVFANSYDGTVVCSLEAGADGGLRVAETAITQDFQSPKNPAEVLGIAAGLPSTIDEKNRDGVSDEGEATLEDGTKVRLLKADLPKADSPEGLPDAYYLFKIRTSDNTIAEMEWLVGGESMLVVRRLRTETVESPAVSWNLAGIETLADDSWPGSKVVIRPDMVVPKVSVQRMIERANFETYVFASNPPWAGEFQITDILDIVSPPQRMFAITYRAQDGRHVVLIQSPSYNRMLGPLVKMGTVVYTSPKGFKVWSGVRDKWLAGILLKSARAAIKDRPSKDRTGYVLESPAGTFPALAVNGQLTDDELHALIDSLVPAREYQGR